MILYPKIYGPFKRHTEGPLKNKLMRGVWTSPEFEVLANLPWTWSEKIDGTNIRVGWDGHKALFGGRTDNAMIPALLFMELTDMFPAELFEQRFGEQEVTLYGEGFGPKIQKVGSLYSTQHDFHVFDVRIGKWWLSPGDVRGVAESLGIGYAYQYPDMSPLEAVYCVENGLQSAFGNFFAEGMVGRAPAGLLSRSGDRIAMKVKHVDFYAA